MIIYILSDPTSHGFMMTANRNVVMAARKAAKDTDEPLEVFSWDTEATAIYSVSPEYPEAGGVGSDQTPPG